MMSTVVKYFRQHFADGLRPEWRMWAVRYCTLICGWAILARVAARQFADSLYGSGAGAQAPAGLIAFAALFLLRLLPGFALVPKALIYAFASIISGQLLNFSVGSVMTAATFAGVMLYVFSMGPARPDVKLLSDGRGKKRLGRPARGGQPTRKKKKRKDKRPP